MADYKTVYVKGRGTVLLHRLVMEQLLGRELLPEEHVHHKDHNKQNNAPENLELCPTARDHMQEHAYGKDELIQFLISFNDEYGHWPTCHDCTTHLGMPSPATFARAFGSMKKAREAAECQLDLINRIWEEG